MLRTIPFLLLLALGACSHERLCPSPIGRIIKDDCATYEQQYSADEAALVSLGDSAITARARADVARLKAACVEYNNCKRTTSAYDNERAALHGRIRAAAKRVFGVPAEDGEARIAALNVIRRTLRLRPESLIKPGDREIYVADLPWFGTRYLPPQPDFLTDPLLLDVWLRTQRAWGVKRARKAWKPYATVLLRGTVTGDDIIELDWGRGKVQCPAAGRLQFDTVAVSCPGDALALVGGSAQVKVRLIRGGQPTELGTRRFRLDAATTTAMLPRPDATPVVAFHPADGKLPAIDEQPALVTVLPAGATPRAQCSVDGRSIGEAIEPSDRSAPLAVAWKASRHVGWWRYDFSLPFIAAQKPEDATWPKAGAWRCAIRRGGQTVQTLQFTVEADGRLSPHPDQARSARAAWMIEQVSEGAAAR